MELLTGFLTLSLTAVILASIGYWFAVQQRKREKRDEQNEAVASLRFELQSNLVWTDDPFGSRNYLRDEAWVALKSKGYISYLPTPIPRKVIAVYCKTHGLNEHIRILKEEPQKYKEVEAEQDREILKTEIKDLMTLLDTKYPKIGKNYKRLHQSPESVSRLPV